jgi:outer membrane protein OmpA-like peptidoglycan-associated protein
MVTIRHILLFLLLPAIAGAQGYTIIPVNSGLRGSVYAPAYLGNQLVVCSNQKDRINRTVLSNQGIEPIDLYILDTEKEGSAQRFDERFRTDYNDGPITFNEAGTLCIVSRNQNINQSKKDLQNEVNRLGLFYARKNGDEWSVLAPLPFNNSEYMCTHPALEADGKTLIFASNKPGGLGGYDLWKSTYENGIWSQPENLGENVNSKNDELFPSINGGTIYFSSNRTGLGGMDIYSYNSSVSENSLKHLDAPVNSEFDDFGLITKNKLDAGYFSSNRDGEDNLYQFEFVYPEFSDCDSLVETVFCYTLYEENAHDLGGADSLVYQWSINDVKLRGVEVEYCFPGPGDYEVSLDIIDNIIGKTYSNQAYYFLSLAYEEQPYITSPDTVSPGEVFALDAQQTNLPNLLVDHYYWDMGDDTRAQGIQTQHSFDKVGTYKVQLGVTGYQSEIEAKDCVYKVIVCTDKSFGKDTALANMIPDEVDNKEVVTKVEHFYTEPNDSGFVTYGVEVFKSPVELEKEHQLFKLLGDYEVRLEYDEEKDAYLYVVGHWEKITDAYPTWREIVKLGVDDAVVRSFILENIDEILLDKVFVLDDVQFDSDRWNIKNNAKSELDKLVKILKKFPGWKLEISAHTDATATFEHNMTLSNRRAYAVRDYLVKQKIEVSRLSAKGFGETNPIDSNETEEGKQNNRRVEFKLIIK